MENNFKLPKAPEIKYFQKAEYQRKINSAKHRMRPKPFVERFKALNTIGVIGTFFFPAISVLTAIAFLYSYINGAIGLVYVSIAIAVIVLTLLESVKNLLLNNGLDTYFSNSGKPAIIFMFALVFSIGSFIMSYQGAELLVKNMNKSKEQIIGNTTKNISEIKSKYSDAITQEKTKIADLKNKAKKQWKKLNTPEQNKLILIYEQNIKQFRAQEQKEIDISLNDKKENLTKATVSVNYNAYVFKVFAGINEFLTILSIAFVAFYAFKTVRQDMDLTDYKGNPEKYNELPSSQEFKPVDVESLPRHGLNIDTRSVIKGFLREKMPNERSPLNDERIMKETNKKRTCKNCGNEFDYKHWNKQYCSDACRIDHWQKKTGKILKLKRANQ